MATTQQGMEKIRTEQPVQNTIHNLVQTLSTKLDSAARYGLYTDDARRDGYNDCAEMFEKLASREEESISDVVRCLQKHIGDART
jgi:rubrerythrin